MIRAGMSRHASLTLCQALTVRLPVEINPGPDERCQQVGQDKQDPVSVCEAIDQTGRFSIFSLLQHCSFPYAFASGLAFANPTTVCIGGASLSFVGR